MLTVSIPSIVELIFIFLAHARIASTTYCFSFTFSISMTKDLSIFIASIGKVISSSSAEKPVPKSSSAILIPFDLRKIISFLKNDSSRSLHLSVSSRHKFFGGYPTSSIILRRSVLKFCLSSCIYERFMLRRKSGMIGNTFSFIAVIDVFMIQ